MYIVIAGGGVVGRNLTAQLVENHDVVVIDLDESVCERIYSDYGAISINGSATNIKVLKEAGIAKADVAVGVMRNDADNLAFSLLAKNYDIEQIMVRMRDPEYESAYQLAGATTIAGVIDLMVEEFVLDIEQPDVRKVYSLSGGKAEISILTIPEEAACVDMTISSIANAEEFPEQLLIAGKFDYEADEFRIPHGNTRLEPLDQVFLVGPANEITKAANYLTAE
ncbi:potassium channel family protein [Halanaerobacter jeridensis]|uniref:Trk system potassium uptake protein TrkA n=1 Tax=Halanaerobacter jeridensis TaxID=706427 RepID=A0A939BRN7_9FIRM|nr:NAD-binding protein [Halanaerobacter jeridensis]MBM7556206.1 trk system potassium uptake protein TrkA [Halanaerobacter jeridensis]